MQKQRSSIGLIFPHVKCQSTAPTCRMQGNLLHLQEDLIAGAFRGGYLIYHMLCGRERRCRQVQLCRTLLLLTLHRLRHERARPGPGCPCGLAELGHIGLHRPQLPVQPGCELLQGGTTLLQPLISCALVFKIPILTMFAEDGHAS